MEFTSQLPCQFVLLQDNHDVKPTLYLMFASMYLPRFYCICSDENLRAALNKMGVGGHALEEIMDKVKNRHYQVLYFIAVSLTEQYVIPELTSLSGMMKYTASLHIDL